MTERWMSPLQRAVRVLQARLAELETRLPHDGSVWADYLATLREYRETRAMLAPGEPVTRRELGQRFKRGTDAS
jgi:hypothetical protein